MRIRTQLRRRILGSGRFVSKSEDFHQLFPMGAAVERVAGGFRFTEGPVWLPEAGGLLFTDLPANRIWRLEPDGTAVVFREPSGHANGMTLDDEGRLIVCEQGPRRVTRTGSDGSIIVLADSFRGRRLNSPNDVVMGPHGSVWFTDPPYGIRPEEQEQPAQGVYRIPHGGGAPVLVAGDFDRPNGLAFSPDGRTLYVDDSSTHRRHVRAFGVNPAGQLSGNRLFHCMKVRGRGVPDGMKVDEEGRVWCTGAGGVWVISPEGRHLGTILFPEQPANCAWGGQDRRTLYITAETSVYRIRTDVKGIAPGPWTL